MKSIQQSKRILLEIPENICDLYDLKSDMSFEVKTVEMHSSKLIISFLCDLPSDEDF
jgi:predicted transcriptional regulator